jgi:GNAT superfamily N-acetyltransferase
VKVTVHHLEMREPAELRPVARPSAEVEAARVDPPDFRFNRAMYEQIGGAWSWYERLGWDDERWREHVGRPEMETWVCLVADRPAGYFELERQDGNDVEIAYFGLLSAYIGRGLGGYLLTTAVLRAWEVGAFRVWVHTCTLDHPGALANYEARGFRRFKRERIDGPPGVPDPGDASKGEQT